MKTASAAHHRLREVTETAALSVQPTSPTSPNHIMQHQPTPPGSPFSTHKNRKVRFTAPEFVKSISARQTLESNSRQKRDQDCWVGHVQLQHPLQPPSSPSSPRSRRRSRPISRVKQDEVEGTEIAGDSSNSSAYMAHRNVPQHDQIERLELPIVSEHDQGGGDSDYDSSSEEDSDDLVLDQRWASSGELLQGGAACNFEEKQRFKRKAEDKEDRVKAAANFSLYGDGDGNGSASTPSPVMDFSNPNYFRTEPSSSSSSEDDAAQTLLKEALNLGSRRSRSIRSLPGTAFEDNDLRIETSSYPTRTTRQTVDDKGNAAKNEEIKNEATQSQFLSDNKRSSFWEIEETPMSLSLSFPYEDSVFDDAVQEVQEVNYEAATSSEYEKPSPCISKVNQEWIDSFRKIMMKEETNAVDDSTHDNNDDGDIAEEKSRIDKRSWASRVTTFRNWCGALVNHSTVQLVIVILIVLNAIMMGVATFDFVQLNPTVNAAFNMTDQVFLIIFTVESGLQLIYHGLRLFQDGWLLFDFIVIVMSWSFESMQVIRSFRIFRALRLIARLSVLKQLVNSIFQVVPSMTAIIMLLCLILYIYAVMCTVLFGDLYDLGYTDQNYFGTLFESLFTLFGMMTLEWASIARQVMSRYYWSWILFTSFLVLTGFILYSLIIAVVCDAVKIVKAQQHWEEMQQEMEANGDEETDEQVEPEPSQRLLVINQRIAAMTQYQGNTYEQLLLVTNELVQIEDLPDNSSDCGGEEKQETQDAWVGHMQLQFPPLASTSLVNQGGSSTNIVHQLSRHKSPIEQKPLSSVESEVEVNEIAFQKPTNEPQFLRSPINCAENSEGRCCVTTTATALAMPLTPTAEAAQSASTTASSSEVPSAEPPDEFIPPISILELQRTRECSVQQNSINLHQNYLEDNEHHSNSATRTGETQTMDSNITMHKSTSSFLSDLEDQELNSSCRQHDSAQLRDERNFRCNQFSHFPPLKSSYSKEDLDTNGNYSTGATGTIPDQDYVCDDSNCMHVCDDSNCKHELTKRSSLQPVKRSMTKCCVQFSAFRDLCGAIINNSHVQLAIVMLIVLNAIENGLATFDFVEDNPAVSNVFEKVDRAFLVLFTVESGMQLIYHGLQLFADGWLCFDFMIVVLSWTLEPMQICRALRSFRAFRLIARLTVLKSIVNSIFAVMPSLATIVMLLSLVLYIYAVMCTVLFGDMYADGETEENYFGTLFLSLFTLFTLVTLEYSTVVRQVLATYYWSGPIFLSFLIFTGFILYSLITAVVCDAVTVQETADKLQLSAEEDAETIQRLYALEQHVTDMQQKQEAIVELMQLIQRKLVCQQHAVGQDGNLVQGLTQDQEQQQEQEGDTLVGQELRPPPPSLEQKHEFQDGYFSATTSANAMHPVVAAQWQEPHRQHPITHVALEGGVGMEREHAGNLDDHNDDSQSSVYRFL